MGVGTSNSIGSQIILGSQVQSYLYLPPAQTVPAWTQYWVEEAEGSNPAGLYVNTMTSAVGDRQWQLSNGSSSNPSSFQFTQASPSALWTINHNLGFRPTISILNAGYAVVEADVQHLSVNVAQISFVTSQTGFARCT